MLFASTGRVGTAPLDTPRIAPAGVLAPMAARSPLEPAGMYVAALRLVRSPADTVKFRVCKDLSICYLEFGPPQVGIVPGPSLAPTGVLTLAPLPVPPVPMVPVAAGHPGAGWLALGVPLFIGAFVPHPSGRPGGGGPPPPPGTVTPEPSSILLMLTGVAGVAVLSPRRRRS